MTTMKNRLNQMIFATCFTCLGAAMTMMGIVALDTQAAKLSPQQKQPQSPVAQQPQAVTTSVPTGANPPPVCVETPDTSKPKTILASQKQQADTQGHSLKIELKKGNPVLVYDLIRPEQPATEFVPLYNAAGKFDRVAIYETNASGHKSFSTLFELMVSDDQFPSISLEKAQKAAAELNKRAQVTYQGKLVTLPSSQTPFYHFVSQSPEGVSSVVLVDALSGYVEQLSYKAIEDERKLFNMNEDDLDKLVTLDDTGSFNISPEELKKLPVEEQKMIQIEKDFFNRMIEKGVVKMDDKGNLIENNMTEEHMQQLDEKLKAFEHLPHEASTAL